MTTLCVHSPDFQNFVLGRHVCSSCELGLESRLLWSFWVQVHFQIFLFEGRLSQLQVWARVATFVELLGSGPDFWSFFALGRDVCPSFSLTPLPPTNAPTLFNTFILSVLRPGQVWVRVGTFEFEIEFEFELDCLSSLSSSWTCLRGRPFIQPP